MHDGSRFLLRLRRRLLRGYEISLMGLLLGIALGAALPATPAERASAAAAAPHCGKNQSSTVVMHR